MTFKWTVYLSRLLHRVVGGFVGLFFFFSCLWEKIEIAIDKEC